MINNLKHATKAQLVEYIESVEHALKVANKQARDNADKCIEVRGERDSARERVDHMKHELARIDTLLGLLSPRVQRLSEMCGPPR